MDLSRQARNAIMRQLDNSSEAVVQPTTTTQKKRGRPKKSERKMEIVDGIVQSEVVLLENLFQLNDLKKQKKLMENAMRFVEQKITELERKVKTQKAESVPF
jgi:hypothetical protein